VPLTPGSTFERYEIQSLIGRGGMGEVYRALDSRLHRPVALKVLRTDADASAIVAESGGVQRLLREARAAAALNHANSVAIYELGEAEGIAYIAMELVTGVTLRRYLGEGNVSVDTKVMWLVDAARALWAAHRAGLVHRDVKPGNIMVSEEGVVKVLDFGLAKPVNVQKDGGFETLMGQVLGTPRYMAPEQLEGASASAAADQYAFGLTVYEVISGEYPGGPLAGNPPSLDTKVEGVSAQLAQVVARMMARSIADRFPTMEAAAHALRGCLTSAPNIVAVPVAAPLPSNRRGVRESEHPTVAHPAAEPISASREIPIYNEGVIEKSKTLPLGVPLKVAIGAETPSPPTSSQASLQSALNKTMPLARPISIGSAQALSVPPASGSSGRLPQTPPDRGSSPQLHQSLGGAAIAGLTPTSGVYPSNAPASAAAEDTAAREQDARSARTALVPRPSRTWIPIVLVSLLAIAAGGIAAWLSR
jgi:serine/threonine protein kinase